MNLIERVMLRLATIVSKKKDTVFTCDVSRQKIFLASLPEPATDIERSYYQYLCQMFLDGRVAAFVYNLGAVFVIPFILTGHLLKARPRIESRGKRVVLFLNDGKPFSVVPEELKIQYGEIKVIDNYESSLSLYDLKYIFRLFLRCPFSYLFLLKCIIKIARCRHLIEIHNPKALIVCNEFSFTSSVMTDYCNALNIEHINVMHGEKLFHIRDSFFRFNRCYVWDEFYRSLFIQLRAMPKQFIIAIPMSLKFSALYKERAVHDFTYYLGGESTEQLQSVANTLRRLKKKSFKIAIRPHPRFSDKGIVAEVFKDFWIENVETINIEESLMMTSRVVALMSTVIFQAYCNNIMAVIDDVSCSEKYNKLKDLNYMMLSKEHYKLSSYL